MSAAATASPGDRFTDSDGGTWVRASPTVSSAYAWVEIDRDGLVRWHSQGEAEKAGLIELANVYEKAGLIELANVYADGEPKRTVQPLDPSSPDDLRQVAALVWASDIAPLEAVNYICNALRMKANRLDRERAEQAQDEADRKLAEAVVTQVYADTDGAYVAKGIIALAAIRAERARASAKGSAS